MKLSYSLIFVSILSFILCIVFFTTFNEYLNAIALSLSVVTFIIGILWEKENRKSAQLSRDENRLQHLQIIDKIDSYENQIKGKQKEIENLSLSNTKFRQLVNKVTTEMRKENFSKEKILSRLDKPLYSLLLFKGHEHDLKGSDNKPLRDDILPGLGFRHLKGNRGTYVLPPSNLPVFNSREDLLKWINNNIFKKIPKNYRYVITYIQLIDLRFTFFKKEDKLTKKEYDYLLDVLSAEELLSFSEGLNYLQKRKKLSVKDIIEIPHLSFLLDNTSLSLEDKELLRKKDDEIVKRNEEDLGREIFTRDFVEIDDQKLSSFLEEYVKIKIEDINIIKQNAKFWLDLFNKDYSK